LKNSWAGKAGCGLEPVSSLAGFSWRENIALIGGLAAKEVVLGTMGTAYSMGDIDPEAAEPLSKKLAADSDWNKLRAFVLLLFVVGYAPCLATLAAIKKETGSWKWTAFSAIYSTAVAFIVCVVVYQVGLMIG
jgi:ferrous iron transport protein B